MLAARLNNIGKKYIISHEKEAIIRHVLPKFLRIKTYEELWALRQINLEVKQGLTYGVIGRNGAGKTTLLNIISGVTFPSWGEVFLNGKVSALLSLGAGFHPDLTGQENIYINGSILGLKIKEIKKRFKDIVEFSELGNFISAPLQTYSAGMYMRLGFAIAINVDFDILLMDELLTVGDISFQDKCLKRLRQLRNQGKTIILVSQSLDLLEGLADELILLNDGKILSSGKPKEVINLYQEIMGSSKIEKVIPKIDNKIERLSKASNPSQVSQAGWGSRSGNKEVQIYEVKLLDKRNKETSIFKSGRYMKIKVGFIAHKDIDEPHFGVAIFRQDGTYCYGPNTKFDGLRIKKIKKGRGEFSIEYRNLNLLSGRYLVSVAIWEKEEKFAYDNHYASYRFEVVSDKKDHGILYLNHKWRWRLP